MSSYQTVTSSKRPNLNWDDPSAWVGGVVPGVPDADVTVTSIPDIRFSTPVNVTVLPLEGYQVRSVANGGGVVTVDGTLVVSGPLDVDTTLAGGALTAGSTSRDLGGYGTVTVGGSITVPNVTGYSVGSPITGFITSSNGALSVTAGQLDNQGLLFANGSALTITLTGGAGAFRQLSGATLLQSGASLTGLSLAPTGTYQAANGGTLSLNVGGTVATDAALVVFGSNTEASGSAADTIQFFDPGTGTFQPLQATLQAVSGKLTVIGNQDFAAVNPLTISGGVSLQAGGTLSAPLLTLLPGGTLSGSGTVGGPVTNDGTITSGSSVAGTGRLVLSGPVSGSGTVVVGFASSVAQGGGAYRLERGTLELGAAASANVVFQDGFGTLQLDSPGDFTGTIRVVPGVPTSYPATASSPVGNDQVILAGVTPASVTGYSYAGDATSGILTIQEGAAQQTLRFASNLSTASFAFSAAPGAPGLAITVTPLPAVPTLTLTPLTFPKAGLITNGDAVPVTGTASAGTAVSVTAGGSTVAAGLTLTYAAEQYDATPTPALAPGLQQVAATATATNSAGSAQFTTSLGVDRLPSPVNGVTTADASSFDLKTLLGQGYAYGFIGGTQAVQLTNGTLSLGTGTTQALVSSLYSALLHRPADPAGLGNFVSQINNGVSVGAVAQGLLDSPEGQRFAMGTEPASTFVLQMYHSFLNREPSTAEQSFYVDTINSGVTRGQVVATFATSPEAASFRAATPQYYAHLWSLDPQAALVTQLYETGLGREAGQAETQGWVQQLVAGMSPQQFAQEIAASAEFGSDHNGQSPQDFVTGLYRAGLGRTPASGELAGWVNQVSAGAPPAATLLGIGNSAEAAARLSPSI